MCLFLQTTGRRYLDADDLKGKVFVTSGLGGMSGAQAKASVIAGCVGVVAEVLQKKSFCFLRAVMLQCRCVGRRNAPHCSLREKMSLEAFLSFCDRTLHRTHENGTQMHQPIFSRTPRFITFSCQCYTRSGHIFQVFVCLQKNNNLIDFGNFWRELCIYFE